jgi:hypothetical protein
MFRKVWTATAFASLALAIGNVSIARAADAHGQIACRPESADPADDRAGIEYLRLEWRCVVLDRLESEFAKDAGVGQAVARQKIDEIRERLRKEAPEPAVYEKLSRDMRDAAAGAAEDQGKHVLESVSIILHDEAKELERQEAAALEAATAGGNLRALGLDGTVVWQKEIGAGKRCPPLSPADLSDLARPNTDPRTLFAEGRRQEACDPDFAALLYRRAAERGLAEAHRAIGDLERSRQQPH